MTSIYFKTFNIRNLRVDINPKNVQLVSQGVPQGQNLACTFLPYPQRFFQAQRGSILINLSIFKHMLGVMKETNIIYSYIYP